MSARDLLLATLHDGIEIGLVLARDSLISARSILSSEQQTLDNAVEVIVETISQHRSRPQGDQP